MNAVIETGRNAAVYVVIAIDTEGPIDDPRKPDILSNWDRVNGLVERLFSDAYRDDVLDSAGRGAVLSWFILTLTGFRTNPFNRAMGYHAVYDHYLSHFGEAMASRGDEVYWHYHHPAPSGIGNEWSKDWLHCQEYDQILARLALERNFFPSCFRAGGRIENDDTSWWLEEIIPFDYSACTGSVDWDNKESDGQRLRDVCDWSRSPTEWTAYHPSADDYQAPGGMQRWIFRCPDLDSRVHSLAEDDIAEAFERARAGNNAILSFFEHDRRDITYAKLADANRRIAEIAKRYPDTPWYFANARDAAIAATNAPRTAAPQFQIKAHGPDRLLVACSTPLFGRSPFVAFADEKGDKIRRVAPLITGHRKWLVDIPADARYGVIAANSPAGEAGITRIDIPTAQQTPNGEQN